MQVEEEVIQEETRPESRSLKILFIALPKNISAQNNQVPALKSPPTTFLWLSGVLLKAGHDAEILDANTLGLGENEILKEIEVTAPDIVGFTVFTSCYMDVVYMAKRVRARFPKIKIAVGGYHVTSLPEDFQMDCIDLIFSGEAENSLLSTMNRLGQGDENLEGIGGVTWFDQEKQAWVRNPNDDYIMDFDHIPHMPYSKVLGNQYNTWWTIINPAKHKYMAIVTGKGCPVNCSFCDVTKTEGQTYRCMSAERVIDEFAHMYFDLGITHVEIRDPFFTIYKDRVMEISRGLIERGIKVEWGCSATAGSIHDPELTQIMAKSGCRFVFVGVESGNEAILKREKKVGQAQVRKAIRLIREAGMQAHCSFIFGLEGENPKTLQETMEFSLSLDPNTASFSIAMPLPGTAMYDSYKEKGYITTFDWKDYGGDRAVFETETLTPEILEQYMTRAHRRFYFRPSYIWKRLISIRSIGEMKFYFSMGYKMLFDVIAYKR